MKDYNFIIKVSEFLHEPSTCDSIQFKKKFSTRIHHLSDDGIDAEIEIQGLNKDQVSLQVIYASCTTQEVCDFCGDDIKKTLTVEDVSKKVYMQGVIDGIDDDEIVIDPRTETINTEHFITSLLILSSNVVNKCTNCEKETDTEEGEMSDLTNVVRKKG